MSDDLETAARAFAAADAFERDAAALRAELRRLRAAGRVAPSWGRRWAPRPAISAALPRIAVEAAFLVAVAVFAGVAGFGALAVVLALAGAWLVVCGVEWAVRRGGVAAPAEPADESFLDALAPRVPAPESRPFVKA